MIDISFIIWIVIGIILVISVVAIWALLKPKHRPEMRVNERPVRKMYFGGNRKI